MQLLGPNPPLNIGTLYDETVAKKEKETGEKMEPFRIEVRWTQQAMLSWPPAPGEEDEERQLRQDYSKNLSKSKWYWVGTQYADGNWLRPGRENSYYFRGDGEGKFMIRTICGSHAGKVELHQESIEVKIEALTDETCVESKTVDRFIDDFNQVINLNHEDDRLTLRISNDEGVMHFQR